MYKQLEEFDMRKYLSGRYELLTDKEHEAKIICTEFNCNEMVVIIKRDEEVVTSASRDGKLCDLDERLMLRRPIYQRGDFVAFGKEHTYIGIVKKFFPGNGKEQNDSHVDYFVIKKETGEKESDIDAACYLISDKLRLATDDEVESLKKALEKEGKKWNPYRMEIEELEYEPEKLERGDAVLVRDDIDTPWRTDIFIDYRREFQVMGEHYPYICCTGAFKECVSYDSNKSLLKSIEE